MHLENSMTVRMGYALRRSTAFAYQRERYAAGTGRGRNGIRGERQTRIRRGNMNTNIPEIERSPGGSLPRMGPGQRRQAGALIRASCCNFDDGDCILLGDVCAQIISNSVCCRWFRWAVLPQDAVLENGLIRTAAAKRCAVCKRPFIPRSNRAKYCPRCGPVVRRCQKAESERKRRSRVDN